MHRFVTFLGVVAGLQTAFAQVSLYVPGFDPQPLSAVAIGVDSQGQTTWELSPGSLTNSDEDIGLVGTATLVEGSQGASLNYVFTDLSLTVGASCTFAGDQAICTAAADGTTITTTEAASKFVVQAVTTGIPAAPSESQNGDSASSPTSGSPAQNSQSGSASSPTSGSPSQNESQKLSDLDVLSSPPSEVESSHSIPPALMLKYPDGREIPIPRLPKVNPSAGALGSKHSHSHSSSSKSRSPIDPSSPQHRSRSGSNPSGRSFRYPDLNEREKLRSHSPEEIRILPSESPSQTQSGSDRVPRAPTHYSSQQNRSRSLPRDTFSPASQDHDPMPISPQGPYSSHHSHSHHHHSNSSPVQLQHTPPMMPTPGLAQTQPIPWHHQTQPYPPNGVRPDYTPPSRSHFKHSPPSIVYAPSHNRTTSNYQPPMIFSHPPNVGPNGMMYSHSVPPTQPRHPHAGPPPQPPPMPLYHGRMPIPEEMRPRTREGDMDRDRERERERDRDRERARDRDRDRSVDRDNWVGERERTRTHSGRTRSKSNSSRHSPKVERSEKSSSSWGKSSTRTRSGRDRSRSLPLEQDMPMPGPVPHGHKYSHSRSHSRYARPPSPAESAGSGSTYYVLPNGRQKIHVLQPSSFQTATSATKSPMSPVSPTGSLKKSFFKRVLGGFGLAGRLSSNGSAKGSIDGGRLQRRHSIGTHSSGRAGH
ncbi:hypothetical protein D9758_000911 [Tetrapyrgos nigripes]|uniref:Uncharacterized protein n=1 Tax=Tetrapyrgos nigripes TaxID=182062 RepID=A0A8H5GZA1_9AGAR|nr:hypothetical protein D9758_000911 [Tetrapyrgos nigripes]